jgi:hypothetical protein
LKYHVYKVRGLTRFAEQFVRLEIDGAEAIRRLLLVSQASQLDPLFHGVH